ncbi:MAG: DUF6702 family protein [Bacteroidota bacterium]
MIVRTLLITLFLQLTTVGYGHDIRLAIFELSQSENSNGLQLSISFDKEDLGNSIRHQYPSTNGSDFNELIVAYLNENFKLTINDQCLTLQIGSIEEENDFIRLKAAINEPVESVSKIRVFNTCLIDYTEGHSNIFKCKLNGKHRSFRLTESRISTEFEY